MIMFLNLTFSRCRPLTLNLLIGEDSDKKSKTLNDLGFWMTFLATIPIVN